MPGYTIGLLLLVVTLAFSGLLIANAWIESGSGLVGHRQLSTVKTVAIVTAPALAIAAFLVLLVLL